MTLLTVVQDVCAAVGVAVPTSVFGSIASNRTMTEMLAVANEMAARIATDTRDWTMLRVKATLTGDGINEAFSLPANYARMLIGGEVWRSTSVFYPMRFYPDTNEWLQRRAANYYDPRGEWTMYGGQIHIAPIMGVGTTAYFPYLDKNSIAFAPPVGGFGERFLADTDTFRLPERLLKLGMIYEWKSRKGSPYSEDMGTYQDAILTAMGKEAPAPTLVDRLPISNTTRVAYPWPVPTP